jgi:tetratricopeptide (TPR) repeat protein
MQLGMFTQAQSFLHRALKLDEGLGALRAVVYTLLNLGLVECRIGDQAGAKTLITRAQSEVEPLGDTFAIAISHMYMGLCLEHSKNFSGAIRSYQTAHGIFQGTDLGGHAMDTTAGSARCKHALGFQQEALEHTREVWEYLQESGSKGLEFPILAYQTCANIFKAVDDEQQSASAVEEGWDELMSRADSISDASWRESFIENVPEHRVMSEMWDRQAGSPASRKREDDDGGQ